MARDLHFPAMPLAEEFDVGDDSDLPGYGQPVTLDDVSAIVSSGRGTVEERRRLLVGMREDLLSRSGMDASGEYDDLIGEIETALAPLAMPADGAGTPGAFAFDAADRALQPDEVLERQEEEDRRAREED